MAVLLLALAWDEHTVACTVTLVHHLQGEGHKELKYRNVRDKQVRMLSCLARRVVIKSARLHE